VAVVALSIGASLVMVIPAAAWQRRVAALMGIEGPQTAPYLRTVGVAVLTGAVPIGAARIVKDVIKAVARLLIRRWHIGDEVALFIGTAVVVVLTITVVNGVLLRGLLAGASAVFQPRNAATRPGVEQPLAAERSGSPGSFAAWDTLGFQGRNFTATGLASVAAPAWGAPRVLYLQHASDPVVWWSSELFAREPDWLKEPPGFDRTPSMRWYPIVTFFQVTADMAGNVTDFTGEPPGHGHKYGDTQLDGWVAVAAPPGWTQRDTDRIRRGLDHAISAGGPEFA